jgi:hypothetical protein
MHAPETHRSRRPKSSRSGATRRRVGGDFQALTCTLTVGQGRFELSSPGRPTASHESTAQTSGTSATAFDPRRLEGAREPLDSGVDLRLGEGAVTEQQGGAG